MTDKPAPLTEEQLSALLSSASEAFDWAKDSCARQVDEDTGEELFTEDRDAMDAHAAEIVRRYVLLPRAIEALRNLTPCICRRGFECERCTIIAIAERGA
jgi:hypothetical protein